MLKWLASLGSGVLTAVGLWLLSQVGVSPVENPLWALAVGTLMTKAGTYLTRRFGPAPPPVDPPASFGVPT